MKFITLFCYICRVKTSVVISAFKAEEFIEECLDSIFVQDYLHEVLIAIDGCDSTRRELNRIKHKYDSRLKIFYSTANLSPYPQINQLIKIATGDYILPFGADDVMRPKMLKILAQQKGDADLIRFKCLNFGTVEDSRIGKTYYPGGVKLYKKGVFNVFGGFPKPYLSADSDLQYRIDKFRQVIKIEILQSVLFDRRIHETNLTRTIPKKDRDLSYKRKHYPSILDAYFQVDEIKYEAQTE